MNPGMWQGTVGMFGYGRALGDQVGRGGRRQSPGRGRRHRLRRPVGRPRPDEEAQRRDPLQPGHRASKASRSPAWPTTTSWTSTDQVAKRAIDQGLIGRFGTLDPTDGGRSSRYSLSSRFSTLNDWGVTKFEAYAIRYTMTLFNNFTYFLNNEIDGDQFSQTDSRTILGFHGNHTFKGRLGPFDSETRIGVQGRYDDIDVGLNNTVQRAICCRPCAPTTCRKAASRVYAQNTTHWTPWMRTVAGGRGDWYNAKVVSNNPLNSGNASDFIASPKFSLIFGPFHRTEFFVNAGYGFHCNDVRGVTITVDPATGLPADKVPFLVRSKGAEVGATHQDHPRPRILGRGVRARLRVRAAVRRRRRHHRSEPPEPPRRRRVDQPLQAAALARLRSRRRDDARALHRFRSGRATTSRARRTWS